MIEGAIFRVDTASLRFYNTFVDNEAAHPVLSVDHGPNVCPEMLMVSRSMSGQRSWTDGDGVAHCVTDFEWAVVWDFGSPKHCHRLTRIPERQLKIIEPDLYFLRWEDDS